MPTKRGKLTPKEQDFIRNNLGKFSPKQIALHLERTEKLILEFCDLEHLTYTCLANTNQTEDSELRDRLFSRPYYLEVRKQLDNEELEYFTITWIALIQQFKEDILYGEELAVKQWITLEIRADRELMTEQAVRDSIKNLVLILKREYEKPDALRDNDKIANKENDISILRTSLSAYTNSHLKILAEIKDIQKGLKASRQDRVKRIEDSKTSFSGFLRALEDEQIRGKVGEDIEIMKIAKDKSKQDLSNLHKFADGQVDRPLLTPESIDQEESEKE